MTTAVVGLDDTAEFAVAGVVEACVGREEQELTSLLSPTYLIPAHDCLHYSVEAALRSVQVSRYWGVPYFVLERKIES